MSRKKSILLWIAAFILMVLLAVYQRSTGPTYPVGGKVNVGSKVIDFKLPRSHSGDASTVIKIESPEDISGIIKYRRFKSHDEWSQSNLTRVGKELVGGFPQLDAAGKMMYEVYLKEGAGSYVQMTAEAVVLRFTGYVPKWYLIPHILAMFFAMVIGIRGGFEALAKGDKSYAYCLWTFVLLLIGGMILGPIVQKYAFDAYWTGWPFGYDLTDNKTLATVVMWGVAAWKAKKNPQQAAKWVIIATVVMLAVYMVPHSVLGSEIDYTKVPKV